MIQLIPYFNLQLPSLFYHNLYDEKLLSLENLIELAESLPADMIEREVKSQIFTDDSESQKKIGNVIANIKHNNSYIFLRNVEQIPAYNDLMQSLLTEIKETDIIGDDEIINPMSFIFISSPYTNAPFHMDPEHNFLFQIEGNKKFYLNNHLKNRIISDKEISDFYKDEINFKLSYKDEYKEFLKEYILCSGNGIYVPVTYPHLVNNTDSYSISYSLTFRTKFAINHRNKFLMI